MSKMDDFKKFVGDKPFLKEKIRKKETTWQELYEHYDLYGESDELFQNKEEESFSESDEKSEDGSDKGINGLFDMLSGIDIDKIADGLNGMRKVLSILGELTSTQDDRNAQGKKSKPYTRDDD